MVGRFISNTNFSVEFDERHVTGTESVKASFGVVHQQDVVIWKLLRSIDGQLQ